MAPPTQLVPKVYSLRCVRALIFHKKLQTRYSLPMNFTFRFFHVRHCSTHTMRADMFTVQPFFYQSNKIAAAKRGRAVDWLELCNTLQACVATICHQCVTVMLKAPRCHCRAAWEICFINRRKQAPGRNEEWRNVMHDILASICIVHRCLGHWHTYCIIRLETNDFHLKFVQVNVKRHSRECTE